MELDADPKQKGRDAFSQRKKHKERPKGSTLIDKERLKQGYATEDALPAYGGNIPYFGAYWEKGRRVWRQRALFESEIVAPEDGPPCCNCVFAQEEDGSEIHDGKTSLHKCDHLTSGITRGNGSTKEEERTKSGKVKREPVTRNMQDHRETVRNSHKRHEHTQKLTSLPSSDIPGMLAHRIKKQSDAQYAVKDAQSSFNGSAKSA